MTPGERADRAIEVACTRIDTAFDWKVEADPVVRHEERSGAVWVAVEVRVPPDEIDSTAPATSAVTRTAPPPPSPGPSSITEPTRENVLAFLDGAHRCQSWVSLWVRPDGRDYGADVEDWYRDACRTDPSLQLHRTHVVTDRGRAPVLSILRKGSSFVDVYYPSEVTAAHGALA